MPSLKPQEAAMGKILAGPFNCDAQLIERLAARIAINQLQAQSEAVRISVLQDIAHLEAALHRLFETISPTEFDKKINRAEFQQQLDLLRRNVEAIYYSNTRIPDGESR